MKRLQRGLMLLAAFLAATFAFGQGQDSIRAVGGVLTINIVPSKSYYKVFVDQTITSTVFTGQVPGTTVSVLFVQDATGHSVAFGGNISAGCSVAQTASSTTGCQFLFDSANNQWTAVGGGSGVPGQFNVKTYGAIGDAKSAVCSVSSNSNIVTSSAAHFLANAKVNQLFWAIDGSVPIIRIPFNQAYPMATITSVDSDTQIHVSTNANGTTASSACVWGTQEEDASINSAAVAAGVINGVAPGGSLNTNTNNFGPTTSFPSNIFIPPGGYIVKDQAAVFKCASSGDSGTLMCPNFIGAGSNKVTFYIEPTANSPLIQYGVSGSSSTNGVSVGGFAFTSAFFPISAPAGGFATGFIYNDIRGFDFYDIDAFNFGMNTNLGSGIIYCAGCQNGAFRSLFLQGGTLGANTPWFTINAGGDAITVRDSLFSNANGSPNVYLQNSSKRNPNDSNPSFEGILIDECTNTTGGAAGSGGDCLRLTNSQANFVNSNVWGGVNGAISVDGTSTLWLSNSNSGAFSTGNNAGAIQIASGGTVFSTGNVLRGNASGFVLNGPAGATYIDSGSNTYQNCVNAACTAITAATYATQFATGGIVPKASIQMPSNTVYAVNGNLLATAQNLVQVLLPVNQQLQSITAQSGGTTPANSSCATPPVITLSDGTRSATMTMTSGKTFWRSDVDAVTNINQVFASGSVLTVSIGANTCATPPSNVSVTYNVQSVLNP